MLRHPNQCWFVRHASDETQDESHVTVENTTPSYQLQIIFSHDEVCRNLQSVLHGNINSTSLVNVRMVQGDGAIPKDNNKVDSSVEDQRHETFS